LYGSLYFSDFGVVFVAIIGDAGKVVMIGSPFVVYVMLCDIFLLNGGNPMDCVYLVLWFVVVVFSVLLTCFMWLVIDAMVSFFGVCLVGTNLFLFSVIL